MAWKLKKSKPAVSADPEISTEGSVASKSVSENESEDTRRISLEDASLDDVSQFLSSFATPVDHDNDNQPDSDRVGSAAPAKASQGALDPFAPYRPGLIDEFEKLPSADTALPTQKPDVPPPPTVDFRSSSNGHKSSGTTNGDDEDNYGEVVILGDRNGATTPMHETAVDPASVPEVFAPYQPSPSAAETGQADNQSVASVTEGRPGRLTIRLGLFTATCEINKKELIIGRKDKSSTIVPDVGVEWDDAVSRQHARILHIADADYIEDSGSTNGTRLNGELLEPHTPVLLHDGDQIRMGERTEITYLG